MKIFSPTRSAMYGDLIVSLPHLTYLEKLYPKSYKLICVAPKCKQILPLLYNHPLINNIHITKENDSWSEIETGMIDGFDQVYDLFAPVIHPEWYNHVNIHESIFLMNLERRNGVCRTQEEWNSLTEQEKCPTLYSWFNIERRHQSIAILPESGYANKDISISQRSPSLNWWRGLCNHLNNIYPHKSGNKILQYGHPNSTKIDESFIIDRRNLNLFDMTKEILGCDLVIGTDSGAMHILGAYGMRQICIYTNYLKNHITNPSAFVPKNRENNLIALYGENDINNVTYESVLDALKEIL